MRRALIATAATVVGLVALLDYRSASSSSAGQKVSVGGPSAPGTAAPSTTDPSRTGPSTPDSPTTTPVGTAPPSAGATPTSSYTGDDITYRYGEIVVRIVVTRSRITAIDLPQESATDPRSQSINSRAVPILTQEALAAQGTNIDVVSGATYTSNAFAQSLQSALQKEGK